MTGLIVGSLAPDFEYFIRMSIESRYSHTVSGLFWFDLPLGLLFTFIFHNLIRDNLIDHLPTFLRSRCSVIKQFAWNGYFKANKWVVISSVLLGAASHVGWDAFTHVNGYFASQIPALHRTAEIAGLKLPYYKLLQHLSTLLGGCVVAVALYRLPVQGANDGRNNRKYWLGFSALALIIIAVRFFTGADFSILGNFIMTGMSAGFLSLMMTPLLIGRWHK